MFFQLTPCGSREYLFGHEYKYESSDDIPATFALCPAMGGKGVEPPRAGCGSPFRLWGRIKLVAVYRARVGFIRFLPNGSLSGTGSSLAVGGFGRSHHHCESGCFLFGGSADVVKFSEGLCFRRDGGAGFSVSAVLAVDPFSRKAGWELGISRIIAPAFTGGDSRPWAKGRFLFQYVKRQFSMKRTDRGNKESMDETNLRFKSSGMAIVVGRKPR
jgi:hypothetical protein